MFSCSCHLFIWTKNLTSCSSFIFLCVSYFKYESDNKNLLSFTFWTCATLKSYFLEFFLLYICFICILLLFMFWKMMEPKCPFVQQNSKDWKLKRIKNKKPCGKHKSKHNKSSVILYYLFEDLTFVLFYLLFKHQSSLW